MTQPAARLKAKRVLRRVLRLAAVLTAAFSLLTLLDEWHRLLELFSHFRLQYLATALLLAVALLLFRDRKLALAMFVVAGINATLVAPWYLRTEVATVEDAAALTVLHANVYGGNEDYSRFLGLIAAEQPDIFFVQEFRAGLQQELRSVHEDYPYRELLARDDNFGIAVYSRLPLDSVVVHQSPPYALPSLVVTARTPDRLLTLLSTHPMPPIGAEEFAGRNQQLHDIGMLINSLPTPKVLIGDLNISMWAHHYELLVEQTELRNARRGFGILPSWPVQLPFARIPIDHCLVSAGIEVVDIRIGPAIGSDHLPLIVKLRVGANSP